MITRLEFTVRGTPRPQPRARAQVRDKRKGRPVKAYAHIYNPDINRGWKDAVVLAARQAGLPREPWSGPVRMTIDAYFEREKKHLEPGWPDGAFLHTAKPDRDNVEKAVLDALTSCGLWEDDCQVCDGLVRKWWAARGCAPGVRIVAELLDPVAPRQMELLP